MWNRKWSCLLVIVFILPLFGYTQVQQLNTDEEVMVIAPFNPSITKADKLYFSPSPDTSKALKLKIDYLTTPKLFATNFSLEKLKAAKFVDRRKPEDAQDFIKAGFGMYQTPYVELFINNKMSSKSLVGVHIRHLSTNGGIKDMAYSGHSLSYAEVWTKHIQRKQTTKVSVDYIRDQIHYYGFHPDDYNDTNNDYKEEINQVFSHTGINVDIKGTFDTKKRDWAIKSSYNFFWDHFNSQEHLLDIDAYYDHPVDWVNVKDQYVGLAFSTQTYQTKQSYTGYFPAVDTSIGYFHGLYDITPYYQLGYESVNVQFGVNLSMALDKKARASITPMVKLDVGLMGDQLRLYALVDGGFYNNSLSSLSSENHFVSPIVPLKYTETKYHIKAGLKGHYLSYLDYNAYVETASFKDMPMFITDTASRFDNSFTTIYDGGQKLGVGLELLYKTERWNVKLHGQYQSFTMDTATRAWQKPEFLYELGVSYDILENLKVTGLFIGQSKMYALYQGEKVVDSWVDFSILANYHLSKDLGFFLNFSNIFSNQYHIWYGYPVQSFGLMAGVHFAF